MVKKRTHVMGVMAAVVAALLSGCASMPPQLQSTTTSFADPAFKPGGSLAIIAADAAQNGSLEFLHYKGLIAGRLAANGYAVVDDIASAGQIAIVSYGVDNGRSEFVSVPVYGHFGGSTSYTTRTIAGGTRAGTYVISAYSMPQFGIVGNTVEAVTRYTRAVAIDIVDGPSFRANATKKLLEIRTRSEGNCGTVTAVLPTLIDATFAVFPGESGKPRSDQRLLPADFSC